MKSRVLLYASFRYIYRSVWTPCLHYVVVCAAGLEKKVRELYSAVCRLEEEKYDWEGKLGRQTEEVCYGRSHYC